MGGGVMRAVGKVSGVGILKPTLRGGVDVSPPAVEQSVMRVAAATRSASSSQIAFSSEGASSVADTAASSNQKSSWELVDDWEFACGVEQEVASEGLISASGGGERIARLLFGGVPSLEETQEATADLKDALDKVYLSSSIDGGAGQVSGISSLSSSEETKDCVPYNVGAISVPQPAIQAFKLLNENPAVQVLVMSSPPLGFLLFELLSSLQIVHSVVTVVRKTSSDALSLASSVCSDLVASVGYPWRVSDARCCKRKGRLVQHSLLYL
ncbi:uncharacterized protein LOC120178680 isoform X2 [Hibiscus syriacus]|uniref:uncharacterized protein LOC120178680 isoform X2 n=1 Tax=Hibiscus syriacus TaxID=106335 RepID=UPI0019222CD5|nr:uncharacterized protein LOC120178680 isoform X2 [Hibiscus syriacus]